MVNMMETSEQIGAPTAKPTSEGTGSANSVSTSAQKIIFVASRLQDRCDRSGTR